MAPNAKSELGDASPEDVAIAQVRAQVSDVIDERYNTRWNILRWLQANEFNISKTVHLLRKHLKWRKERKLDEPESESRLQLSRIRQEYAPLSIVGRNRPGGNRLLVVDQAGRIDVNGVMKSVQPTEYLHTMFRNFEDIQRRLMKMEEELGEQCYMHYIFDLNGLSFDPTLLGVVNGPFRVSWQQVGQHYREFIDKFIVVNSPSYINVFWSALSPFVPEQSKQRIVFAGANWKEELLELCDAECLPQRYGGTIPDEQVIKEVNPVPKELYWKPKPGYPTIDSMHKVSIPASKSRSLIYPLEAGSDVLLYSHNESDVVFSVYYSPKENAKDDELEMAIPAIPKCGLPSIDCFDYMAEATGYYHVKVSNEAAWLFPATYRVLLTDRKGRHIEAINQHEKWIKQGHVSKTIK